MKTVGNLSGQICNQPPFFAIHGTAPRRLRQSTQMTGISSEKSAG